MSAFIERRVFVGQTLAARASLYGLRATVMWVSGVSTSSTHVGQSGQSSQHAVTKVGQRFLSH